MVRGVWGVRRVSFGLTMVVALLGTGRDAFASDAKGNVLFEFESQKSDLRLTITSPFAALTGLDSRPTQAEDKVKHDKAMLTLRNPELFLNFDKASGCRVSFVSVSMDLSERRITMPSGGGASLVKNPEGGELQREGSSATVVAEYSGTCEKPALFQSLVTTWFKLFPHGQTLTVKMTRAGATKTGKPLPRAESLTLAVPR